jgi:hypothetical protein
VSLQASGELGKVIERINERTHRFDLRTLFPTLHALAAFDGEDDDEVEEEEEEEIEEEDPDKDKDDKSKPKDKVNDPEKKRLSEEAKKYRLQLREAEKKLEAQAQKEKEQADKDKPEVERLTGEVAELTKKLDKVSPLLESQAVKLAFYESGAAALFQKPNTALKLLDLSDIEVDEGEVDYDAIKELADKLLADEPYLAASGGDDEDGDKEKEPSGRQTNGAKKKKGAGTDFEALAKKFPALRR